MPDRLLLLGTGTCQLEPDRLASAALLGLGDLRLVFDFGRGIASRLAALGLAQDDVEHVVLSHFHPDHLSDLVPYLQAGSYSRIDPRTRDLTVWGPPGLADQIARIVDLCGPGVVVAEGSFEVHAREVRGGGFAIGGRRFDFLELPPAGNHGLRFRSGGKTVALTGDSGFHEREIEFLRGVDLGVIDAGHLSDDEIVELAVRSGAKLLVCSHLYRPLDEAALGVRAAARGFEGRLVVGRDLMEFEF